MNADEETEKEAKKIKFDLAANIKLFEGNKFDILLEKKQPVEIPSYYVMGIEIHQQR